MSKRTKELLKTLDKTFREEGSPCGFLYYIPSKKKIQAKLEGDKEIYYSKSRKKYYGKCSMQKMKGSLRCNKHIDTEEDKPSDLERMYKEEIVKPSLTYTFSLNQDMRNQIKNILRKIEGTKEISEKVKEEERKEILEESENPEKSGEEESAPDEVSDEESEDCEMIGSIDGIDYFMSAEGKVIMLNDEGLGEELDETEGAFILSKLQVSRD